MTGYGYKKYMKKNSGNKNFSLWQIFALSFFGMLLVFTFLIKSFSPSVDTSIGGETQDATNEIAEEMPNVDGRLAAIQDEDQGRSFKDLVANPSEEQNSSDNLTTESAPVDEVTLHTEPTSQDIFYKVYIGSYTSAEQAKVAKDIIQETGSNLTPIVKCLGSNNYTLQVGTFKNKASADALLYTVQQNHWPGRIAKE